MLDAAGAYYAMPVTSGYGNSGVPDFLVCYRGLFIGIEAKAGGGKTTALQESNGERIVKAGGYWLVVNEATVDSLSLFLTGLHGPQEIKE